MADESLATFMNATGCSYDDAFHRLASCGGHLGNAINRFFSIDAGPSGSRRSPQASDSSSSEDDDDEAPARAPVLPSNSRALGVAAAARGRSPASAPSPMVSRWDSEARDGGGGGSKSSRRRRRARARRDKKAGRDRDKEAGGSGSSQSRGEQNGRRRFREENGAAAARADVDAGGNRKRSRRANFFASSSSDDEPAGAQAKNSRRRLNPKPGGDEEEMELNNSRVVKPPKSGASVIAISDSDSDSDKPPPPARKSEKDKLFRVPHGLRSEEGTLYEAKVEAGRRARWLLVNVQSMELASLAQNRDVWGSDLVAQCVKDHFVLWQADADAAGVEEGEGVEAAKVLCYYKVPRDKLPVVLVVDPVTGQAVDKIHGTDPNDFLVSMAPYTYMKPALPVFTNASASAGAATKSTQKPAAAASPTSRQEQAAPTVRKPVVPTGHTRHEHAPAVSKPAEPVAASTAAAAPPSGGQPALVGKVCKMRVRLHDGRVVEKEFGSQCAVAALFAYCRSELGAGAAARRPFRLLRFAGAVRQEIGDQNASFESLRLHMSTVCVELG